jgi:hypothetical protein
MTKCPTHETVLNAAGHCLLCDHPELEKHEELGAENAGPNPNYKPTPPRWHRVEIIAPEGYSFGVVMDGSGCLGIAIKAPGGEWSSDLHRDGENTIAPGHKAYVVRNDGD